MAATANPLGLTDREVLIVWAWATGRTDSWIAYFTGRTHTTVRTQGKCLRSKLCARNRAHATAIVLRAILTGEHDAPALPTVTLTTKRLASAARRAIRDGMDPALALSYVICPTAALTRRAA